MLGLLPEAAIPPKGLRFTGIDAAVLQDLDISRSSWQFDWNSIAIHFWRNDPDRFELAIWKEGRLCGLGIGRPSAGPDNVTIHFVERRSDHTVLKGWIAQMVTDTAEAYGKILGKQRLKIKDPLPGAIPHYEDLRFSLAESIGRTTYYAREIGS
jgi:hypothetical protein